ncbi:MAG: hypothetical protein WCW93_03955, partial [Candidatus Paceibacterota bacterium]
ESGSERALYQSRFRQAVKSADCANIGTNSTCDSVTGYCSGTNNGVSCIAATPGSLSVKKNWAVSVGNETETTVTLAGGQSIQIDLFSPFQTSATQNLFQSFSVFSNLTSYTLYGELTNVTSLVPGVNLLCSSQQNIMKDFIFITNGQSPYLFALNGPQLIADCSYVLRISNTGVVSPSAGVFTVKLYKKAQNVDPINDQIDIPSRLIIASQAVYGNSQQIVRVHAPMRAPLSGLYDFVLFSEQEIVK